jgi:microcompartment protein CcmL/EutN
MQPAIAVLEFDSIARGIEAGDAMAKRAPLEVIRAGTVHPGKYLVLVGGLTADVEEAVEAGREAGASSLVDLVFLPDVHPSVVAGVGGARSEGGEALGVIETLSVPAVIHAADAGVKGARVVLREIRLADELGGKGYVLFGGAVAEVEAAVEHGVAAVAASGLEVAHTVIAQLHAEMDAELTADARFGERVAGAEKAAEEPAAPTKAARGRGRPKRAEPRRARPPVRGSGSRS